MSVMSCFNCAGHRSWRWSDPGGVAVSVQPSPTLRRVHHSAHQWKSDRVHQGPGVAGTEVSQSQFYQPSPIFRSDQIRTTNHQSHQLFFINLQMSNLWTTINARLAVKDGFPKSDSTVGHVSSYNSITNSRWSSAHSDDKLFAWPRTFEFFCGQVQQGRGLRI